MNKNSYYPWAPLDYLTVRPSYAYSDSSRTDLLDSWKKVRNSAVNVWSQTKDISEWWRENNPIVEPIIQLSEKKSWEIFTILSSLEYSITHTNKIDGNCGEILDLLVKRFEAGKRLYDVYYGNDLRGDSSTNFREFSRYVRFGHVLAKSFLISGCLVYLNALLKICDLITAHAEDIPLNIRTMALALVSLESEILTNYAVSIGVEW